MNATTATALRIVNVWDLGSCSGTCQRCGRGIRYSALMSNDEVYGLDCAESAALGRKVRRVNASTFRSMKCDADYARRMEWEAADPRNAAFAVTFLEYVGFYELREFRTDFYEATLTPEQMAAALEIVDNL